MSEVILPNVTANFPIGTEVGVYHVAVFDSGEPVPVGNPIATSVVDGDGNLEFDLPADGTTYIVAAEVAGAWRIMRVTTKEPAGGVTLLEEEVADLTEQVNSDRLAIENDLQPRACRSPVESANKIFPLLTDSLLIVYGETTIEHMQATTPGHVLTILWGPEATFAIDLLNLPRIEGREGDSVTFVMSETGEWIELARSGQKGGGVRYFYNSAVNETDPGVGKLKFNNAAMAAATRLYISETDATGVNETTLLEIFGAGTSNTKGYLMVRKEGDPTKWALFAISGTREDKGSWQKFGVIGFVSGPGGFANGDRLTLEYYRSGDKGEVGEKGPPGEVTKAELEEYVPGIKSPEVVEEGFTPNLITRVYNFGPPEKTIKKITPTVSGHIITLFQATSFVLNVKDNVEGGNLHLAGNMAMGLRDTLTLMYSGTHWVEIARSSNS